MAEEFTTNELHSSLLKWVSLYFTPINVHGSSIYYDIQLEGCLELGGTLTFDPVEVNDGNALSECLVQLVPQFFTTSWRARIITETGGNWKLKVGKGQGSHMHVTYMYVTCMSHD